jgi:hypothetical protein
MDLDFIFISPDHLRFEHEQHVSGPYGGAARAVKVEPDIEGADGYTVTIYNLDGDHPVWRNNIQMAPKRMRLVHQEPQFILLRGYGFDDHGGSFADYGLAIMFGPDGIHSCILQMLDRGVNIIYLKEGYDLNDWI